MKEEAFCVVYDVVNKNINLILFSHFGAFLSYNGHVSDGDRLLNNEVPVGLYVAL